MTWARRTRGSLLLLPLLGLAGSWCGTSHAAPGPKVMVLERSGGRVPLSARERLLRRLLERLARVARARALVPEPKIGEQLAQQLGEARKLSQRFKEREALQLLRRAETRCRGAFARGARIELLLKLLLLRAKLLGEIGRTRALRRTMRRVAALRPRRELDPGTFAPPLIAALKRAQRRARRRPGALLVRGPPGVPLWVDGSRRGTLGSTPLTLNVVVGEHFVVGGAPGARDGKSVQVSAGKRVAVKLAPPSLPRGDAALRELGRARGVAWVALASIRTVAAHKLQLEARLLATDRVDPPLQLRSKVLARSALDTAIAQLVRRMTPHLRGSLATPATRPARRRRRPSLLSRWWFWTAIGAAALAAGGAATAAILLTRDKPGVELYLRR